MPDVTTGQPPMSPDVARQQQPSPVGQMASKQAAQAGGKQGDPNQQFVQQGLMQIADTMTKIAQVTSQIKPQLMPMLQKIAGGFKEFENQFNQQSQGQGQNPPVGSEPSPQAAEEPAAVGM
jgi:hypothetical protein